MNRDCAVLFSSMFSEGDVIYQIILPPEVHPVEGGIQYFRNNSRFSLPVPWGDSMKNNLLFTDDLINELMDQAYKATETKEISEFRQSSYFTCRLFEEVKDDLDCRHLSRQQNLKGEYDAGTKESTNS